MQAGERLSRLEEYNLSWPSRKKVQMTNRDEILSATSPTNSVKGEDEMEVLGMVS